MASDFLPNSELIITDEPNKNTVDVETIDYKLRQVEENFVRVSSQFLIQVRFGSAVQCGECKNNFTCRTLTCPDLIFVKAYK